MACSRTVESNIASNSSLSYPVHCGLGIRALSGRPFDLEACLLCSTLLNLGSAEDWCPTCPLVRLVIALEEASVEALKLRAPFSSSPIINLRIVCP